VRVLAIQLKRIGDVLLTAPALVAIKTANSGAQITLAVHESTSALLPAIAAIDAGIVFGPGRGWTPWQQALTGRFTHVLDFTGTDRSAAVTAISRAPLRLTFEWVRKKGLRSLAYNGFVESSVRDSHTVEHYLHLACTLAGTRKAADLIPGSLILPTAAREGADRLLAERGIAGPFVVIHPGTARPEKYWLPERWADVIDHVQRRLGRSCVITGGRDEFERTHIDEIRRLLGARHPGAAEEGKCQSFAGDVDLITVAALVARADLVVSCDTAMVHLAAAFRRPQIALFGPTNPFHWRPLHKQAVVLSAAQPDAPLTAFAPRMAGAPMERLSTEAVIRATEALLASIHSS
jgi:ADP-heptose:LPS heptosyltransferase